MPQFRRAVRFLLIFTGFIVGASIAIAAYFSRWLVNPPRQRLWATPADIGLSFEEVVFPARDGLRLSGWFIPAQGEGTARPTVILVHGWPWNRLGEAADNLLTVVNRSRPVDLLRLSHALQGAGYNVFSFDLRNHGESADAPPVTFGLYEADDLLGALDYLGQRSDVAQDRIGVVGFSMGGNALLYALPHSGQIKAAAAIQPTSAGIFATGYAYDLLGPLSKLVLPLTVLFYRAMGGLPFRAIEPIFAAASAGATPILFVQGIGDRWGSVDNVAQMVAATPNAVPPVYVESQNRYDGYQHVVDHPELLIDFFQQHMG